MSTRGTIFYIDYPQVHIWDETMDWSIAGSINKAYIKQIEETATTTTIHFVDESKLHSAFPNGLLLDMEDVTDFKNDDDGIYFEVSDGSKSKDRIQSNIHKAE